MADNSDHFSKIYDRLQSTSARFRTECKVRHTLGVRRNDYTISHIIQSRNKCLLIDDPFKAHEAGVVEPPDCEGGRMHPLLRLPGVHGSQAVPAQGILQDVRSAA